MKDWPAFWIEVNTPTSGTAYGWGLRFFGHGMLGICLTAIAALSGDLVATLSSVPVIISALYWLFKERGDLTRGGMLHDGLTDTVAVYWGAVIVLSFIERGAAVGAASVLLGFAYTAFGVYRRI